MRVQRLAWAVVVVVAFALNGCGKGDGGAGPVAGSIVSVVPIASVTKAEADALFRAAGVPVVPENDVEILKIVYRTTDASGALINASGALVIPLGLTAPAPMLSSQHGTTTLKSDVASVPPAAGQPYRRLEALVFGTSGYVTALPDYIGYGDSGDHFHPYLHAKTLASSVVDLLRAARSYCAAHDIPLSDKLFLAGYSEGGYATMAATKAIQEKYTAEFSVTASAPMAGPYDLSTSLLDILNSATYPGPGFVSFAFWAYDRIYLLNELSHIFIPTVAELDTLFDGNHDLLDINVTLSTDTATLFQSQFLTGFRGDGFVALKSKIEANNLHNWTPTVPMRLIHCKGDDIVAFKNSQTAFNNFSANGSKKFVQLVAPTPDGTHAACFGPAMLTAKTWFDTLK